MANPFQKNIRIIFFVRFCYALIFSISVITLYWKKYGLNLLDIFWLQAIFALAVVVFEIPTGLVADKLGRKKTLILSSAIAAGAWVIYAFSRNFGQFVLSELTLGLAFSLLSGTDASLIYESLAELGQTDRFSRIEGRQLGTSHLAEGMAALMGSVLAAFLAIQFSMAASAAAMLAACVACWSLTEPPRQRFTHPRGTLYGFYKISRFVFLRSKIVRYAVPLMAACSLSTMLGVWLYQPLWQARHVPVWLFGVLWAGLSVSASLGGHFAHRWEQWLGEKTILWLLPVPVLAGYLLLAFGPGYMALAGPYLVMLLRGLNMPVLGKYVHQETFSDKRATVLSIQSWLFRLVYFGIGPLIGWIGQHAGLSRAFLVSAGISSAAMFFFIPPLVKRIGTDCTSL